MDDYGEILEHRIGQFASYIGLMQERRRKLTKGSCFIIFNENCKGKKDQCEAVVEKAIPKVEVIEKMLMSAHAGSINVEIELPQAGWRSQEESVRFVQFSFNPKYFDIDIPNTTLYRNEAVMILRDRQGFFFVQDRPEFEHPQENAQRFQPLRKVYVYGDERSAAEDMAYVLFDVWRFPIDWRFYVTASAFHGEVTWEKGKPLE